MHVPLTGFPRFCLASPTPHCLSWDHPPNQRGADRFLSQGSQLRPWPNSCVPRVPPAWRPSAQPGSRRERQAPAAWWGIPPLQPAARKPVALVATMMESFGLEESFLRVPEGPTSGPQG